MSIEQVCAPLNEYLKQNKIVGSLMPISVVAMLVCAALEVLDIFISLGSLVSALVFFGFVFFALLVFSTCQFKLLAGGLALYGASYLLSALRIIFRGSMPWSSLIHLLVFLGLAFLAFQKSGGTVDDLKYMAKTGVQTATASVQTATAKVVEIAKNESKSPEAAPDIAQGKEDAEQ